MRARRQHVDHIVMKYDTNPFQVTAATLTDQFYVQTAAACGPHCDAPQYQFIPITIHSR